MTIDTKTVTRVSYRSGGDGGPADETEWLSVESLAEGLKSLGVMVGRSEAAATLFAKIERFGPYKTTVLIQGESGTGKELVARALHTHGPAPKGPFVSFNCSNLVESLAESQLFGHVRGAFTDAREESHGYFRAANGGTLFLDEIGELPMRLQAKLLRAVETYEIQPVGAAHSCHVDIRLVAATNRDLRAMVKAGQFRDDLYYRLNATAIFIPPLRERIDDVGVLVAHFIEHYNRLLGKRIKEISRRALSALMNYGWPGNVREFAHAIESATLNASDGRIDINELPAELIPAAATPRPGGERVKAEAVTSQSVNRAWMVRSESRSPTLSLSDIMKETLLRSLRETSGNRRRAATLLGVSRSTLYRMMYRYGIERRASVAVRLENAAQKLGG